MLRRGNVLRIHPEVSSALIAGNPVVALESTIIAHGFPYPDNLAVARDIEQTVRESGAIPATTAILNGRLCVGLGEDELFMLASEKNVLKCSIRDLSHALSTRAIGATTVSATSWIAHNAGIRVFATGGIGGVHRPFDTFDISSDLTSLSQIPCTVVCAGAKSVLDIPRTVELLETLTVPVVGFRTNEFPAFYTPRSGCPVSCRCDTAKEAADLIHSHHEVMGMKSAVLLTVPPPEANSDDLKKIQDAVDVAVADTKHTPHGKGATPFLLKRIAELSGGASVRVNSSLVKNNARVAAKVSRELSFGKRYLHTSSLVAGGSFIDISALPFSSPSCSSSVCGRITVSCGGVGRNIAEALTRMGNVPLLITTWDRKNIFGSYLEESIPSPWNVNKNCIFPVDSGTGFCSSIFAPDGDHYASVVSSPSPVESITPSIIETSLRKVDSSSLRVAAVDANLPADTIAAFLRWCHHRGILTLFEPSSKQKCVRVVESNALKYCDIITPNLAELRALSDSVNGRKDGVLSVDEEASVLLNGGVKKAVVVTLGSRGVLLCENGCPSLHVPAVSPPKDQSEGNTQGCGDVLAAGLLATLAKGSSLLHATMYGVRAAAQAVVSPFTVPRIEFSLDEL